MSKESINVGTTANDQKGDSLRTAFQKINANFTELYDGSTPYVDNTSNAWSEPAPTTIQQAVDRLATAVASTGTNP
jgi:hypothetical protein